MLQKLDCMPWLDFYKKPTWLKSNNMKYLYIKKGKSKGQIKNKIKIKNIKNIRVEFCNKIPTLSN